MFLKRYCTAIRDKVIHHQPESIMTHTMTMFHCCEAEAALVLDTWLEKASRTLNDAVNSELPCLLRISRDVKTVCL